VPFLLSDAATTRIRKQSPGAQVPSSKTTAYCARLGCERSLSIGAVETMLPFRSSCSALGKRQSDSSHAKPHANVKPSPPPAMRRVHEADFSTLQTAAASRLAESDFGAGDAFADALRDGNDGEQEACERQE